VGLSPESVVKISRDLIDDTSLVMFRFNLLRSMNRSLLEIACDCILSSAGVIGGGQSWGLHFIVACCRHA